MKKHSRRNGSVFLIVIKLSFFISVPMILINKPKTFTLIEMLIVIVIIGILAAALVPRLQDVQSRARDTKRKTDISQIHNALMVYNSDNGGYPQPANASGTCALDADCYRYSHDNASWFPALSGIMTSMPLDPINNGITPWQLTGVYSYMYGNVWHNRKHFALHAKLENTRDADRCEIQEYRFYVSNAGILNCKTAIAGCILCPLLYTRADITQ